MRFRVGGSIATTGFFGYRRAFGEARRQSMRWLGADDVDLL